MPLDHLDDGCALRLVPADPPLDAASWSRVEAALGKLFAQFEREGRVSAWGSDLAAGGAVIAIAWASAETLSGCSHDKLGRLLQAHENDGRRLLDAPPIVVEVDGKARCLDRAALRGLVAEGRVGASTLVFDLRAETLGAWRRGPRALSQTPLARLLAPAV